MLTARQKELVKYINEKKVISSDEAFKFFVNRQHAKAVLMFLMNNGYCEIDGSNYGYYKLTNKGKEALKNN